MYEKRLAWLVVVLLHRLGCSADPNAGNQPDMSMDCGGLGAACCPGSTCSSGACVGGVCQACGGPGQICCAGRACDANDVCTGTGQGLCTHCGNVGEACCAGNGCRGGGCCVNNICTGSGSTCPTIGMTRMGSCGTCGGAGQGCCTGSTCTASQVTCVGTKLRSLRQRRPAPAAATAPAGDRHRLQ